MTDLTKPTYSTDELDDIARYHNWGGIIQDDDGNLSWNTAQNAEFGWRRITAEQIEEALMT